MSLYSNLLESDATLYRPTVGRDKALGTSLDPQVVVIGKMPHRVVMRDVPCSVQEASASVIELYKRRSVDVTATLYFADDIGARVNDRIETVDDNDNKRVFRVQGPSKPVYQRPLSPWVVACDEIL